MDFLPIPTNRVYELRRVRYVATVPYDDGDFYTYPTRAGWLQAQPDSGLPFWAKEMRNASNDNDLERFLQNWIFFGVIHHILSPHGLYVTHEYLDSIAEGTFLSTKTLIVRLEQWLELAKEWSTEQKDREVERVGSCIKTASAPLQILAFESHAGFSRETRILFSALLELLQETSFKIYPEKDYPRHFNVIDLNDAEKRIMQQNGWCLSEIMHAQTSFVSTASRLFMLQMLKPSIDSHDFCDVDNCNGLQIDLNRYSTRHVEESCRCELAGPDPEIVNQCLRSGSFPVLRIHKEGEAIQIETVPFTQGLGYVAASHVWADGLGNPSALEIHRCQIERIEQLVSSIKGRQFESRDDEDNIIRWTEDRSLYFWIDSLCTPVNPNNASREASAMKQLGIARLQQVYSNAAYVLVLDKSMEFTSFSGTDIVETTMRIHTSRWVRRLWTFQEGGLAKTLLINFADQVVSFREIWRQIQELYWHNVRHRSIAGKLTASCANLRMWFHETNRLAKNQAIGNLIHNLSNRRVSVPSDEPLCIAGAFDLSMEKVATAPEHSRMQVFWTLLSQSPRGVPGRSIFNDKRRIAVEGYRWAPKTLRRRYADPLEMFGGTDNIGKGIITARGLRTHLAGWRLQLYQVPATVPDTLSPIPDTDQLKRVINGRDEEGRWYYITQYHQIVFDMEDAEPGQQRMLLDLLADRSKDWYIILDKSYANNGHRALLTWRSTHSSGLTTFRSAMVVWVSHADPATERVWQLCFPYAMQLRQNSTLRMIQAISRFEKTLAWLATRVPKIIEKILTPLMFRIFKSIGTLLWRRFGNDIVKLVEEAVCSDEGQSAMKAAGLDHNNKAGLMWFILHPFMGRYAGIVEKYPESHEWYVD